MSTLDLTDVRAGTLEDARLGSILFPLGTYSAHFLVTAGAQDELFGVFLTGEHSFHMVMASSEGDNWAGFFIDGVRIEADLASATDATHRRTPAGSVVKRADGVFLVALAEERGFPPRAVEMRLDRSGGSSVERAGVAFSRWSVVKGEGKGKIVLWRNGNDGEGRRLNTMVEDEEL